MPVTSDELHPADDARTEEQAALARREARRAGLHVRRLTPDESDALSGELDRFAELSNVEQTAEMEDPASPWHEYVGEYNGVGLKIAGRIVPPRPRLPVGATQRATPRARAVRPRRRRTTGGARDRPRPSADDDEPHDARRALCPAGAAPNSVAASVPRRAT
jgi:hypothetical protein